MALNCPQCGNSIDQDFGLVQCSQCSAMLSIDVDGQVQVAGQVSHEAVQEDATIPVQEAEPLQDLPVQPESFPETAPEPLAEPEAETPFEIQTETEPEPEPVTEPVSFQEEIQQFADKPASAGALVYQLTVKGIDSAQVRNQVLEKLSDRRFGWDLAKLKSMIRGGEIRMNDLNPAQAAMVVRVLSALPVTLEWRQNVFS